jgi:hypothetical protein
MGVGFCYETKITVVLLVYWGVLNDTCMTLMKIWVTGIPRNQGMSMYRCPNPMS